MNNDDINKILKSNNDCDEHNCWITIHLGINPVKGGSPPNESSLINIQILIAGLLDMLFTK